jgi:hypothetical protein
MVVAPHLARLTGTAFALALLVVGGRHLASSAAFDASSSSLTLTIAAGGHLTTDYIPITDPTPSAADTPVVDSTPVADAAPRVAVTPRPAALPLNTTARAGRPVHVTIDNFDGAVHAFSIPALRFYALIAASRRPGVATSTTFEVTPRRAGTYRWLYLMPCRRASSLAVRQNDRASGLITVTRA